ncbi:MAG: hypothetical protein KA217_06850 [Gammaproteobacteria bacterium]|nr:hypothetical protein [Gammaproteobacteria bacterium]
MSELAVLRELLADALARVEALEAAERARDVRERQAELLNRAAAAVDPLASRWQRAQALARRVAARGRSARPPATEADRWVDQALGLGALPASARRLWELLTPERQTGAATLPPSPPTRGGLWDD